MEQTVGFSAFVDGGDNRLIEAHETVDCEEKGKHTTMTFFQILILFFKVLLLELSCDEQDSGSNFW